MAWMFTSKALRHFIGQKLHLLPAQRRG